MPIYGGAFCNYIGLHNYGTVALQKGTATTPTTYCEWNDFKRTKKISEQEYAIQWIKKQGLDSLLVLSPSVFEVQQIKNYDMILLSSFTDGLVRNENVFVYLVTTKK